MYFLFKIMPRGSCAKVSAADRARIVECADGGGDWKALCANLRVNPKTAHVWVKSGAQERRPHAGGRRKALTEEQVDAICGMIEEDQEITLKALKERTLADFQLNVAISTIHNYLEGRLLTLKKVHYITADANNVRNKATLRMDYVQAISAHMQDKTIWMDKTNVNFTVGACKEELQLASELQSLCRDPRLPMSMLLAPSQSTTAGIGFPGSYG